MLVRFIAHAGIYIEEAETSLLIDPWFRDSTLHQPIIESLTGIKTIDFQVPPTAEKIEAYQPNAVLLSHFHPHHSPLSDIRQLVGQSESPLELIVPPTSKEEAILKKLGHYPSLSMRQVDDGQNFTVGPLRITALSHTAPEHLAWLVESPTGSVLHVADARIHSDRMTREIDPLWQKFYALHPDLVFLSAGRNSFRSQDTDGRKIHEHSGLSPIEAARLLQYIAPRTVSLIGTQNHSIWKNRLEYIPETAINEEEFAWALEWLAPLVKFVRVRPGHTFSIERRTPGRQADTSLGG